MMLYRAVKLMGTRLLTIRNLALQGLAINNDQESGQGDICNRVTSNYSPPSKSSCSVNRKLSTAQETQRSANSGASKSRERNQR